MHVASAGKRGEKKKTGHPQGQSLYSVHKSNLRALHSWLDPWLSITLFHILSILSLCSLNLAACHKSTSLWSVPATPASSYLHSHTFCSGAMFLRRCVTCVKVDPKKLFSPSGLHDSLFNSPAVLFSPRYQVYLTSVVPPNARGRSWCRGTGMGRRDARSFFMPNTYTSAACQRSEGGKKQNPDSFSCKCGFNECDS